MPEFATDAAAEVATDEDSLINFVTDENMVDKNWILKRRSTRWICSTNCIYCSSRIYIISSNNIKADYS